MRAPCKFGCPTTKGHIVAVGLQDVVRCSLCNKAQYNAPRTETGRAPRTVQSTHEAIRPNQRARVLQRAHGRCEQCGSTELLHVGHTLSVADGHAQGLSDQEINSDDNLIALCAECNLGMGKRSMPLWLVVSLLRKRAELELKSVEVRPFAECNDE